MFFVGSDKATGVLYARASSVLLTLPSSLQE